MAYQQVPSDDYATAISKSSQSGSTAFPPGYEDLHNEGIFQNYAYMSVEETLVHTFNIDTDLPAPFGRFQNAEEQQEAPNLFVSGEHTQALVNLRGSNKAVIELAGRSHHRRVLEIAAAHGSKTPFKCTARAQGANATIVVPEGFEGTIVGNCKLGTLLAARSLCIVQDATDPQKTRYTVAGHEQNGHKPAGPQAGEEDDFSTVISAPPLATQNGGVGNNGQLLVCLPADYTEEQRARDTEEAEYETRMAQRKWPVRFVNFCRRILFAYGSTSDVVLFFFLLAMVLTVLIGIGALITVGLHS